MFHIENLSYVHLKVLPTFKRLPCFLPIIPRVGDTLNVQINPEEWILVEVTKVILPGATTKAQSEHGAIWVEAKDISW